MRGGHTVIGCGRSGPEIFDLRMNHSAPHDFSVVDVALDTKVALWAAKVLENDSAPDLLINNAGVLRDKSFAKMEPEDFEFVLKVHLFGSAYATKACWEIMREQSYGRVLMTTSSSGLFGNFGQANYGSAKLGLVGLAKTLFLAFDLVFRPHSHDVPADARRETEA